MLEDREFDGVGGERTIKVDVRVITATNQDLYTLVERNRFREDLFYRINVVNIHIPPIRQRKEDIEPLVTYFIRKYCREFNKPQMGIDPQALQSIVDYDWPGNVRVIKNCIERAVLLADGELVNPQDISILRASPAQGQPATPDGDDDRLAV